MNLRTKEEIEKQLKESLESAAREPSPRTLGYVMVLAEVLSTLKDKEFKIAHQRGEIDAIAWVTGET